LATASLTSLSATSFPPTERQMSEVSVCRRPSGVSGISTTAAPDAAISSCGETHSVPDSCAPCPPQERDQEPRGIPPRKGGVSRRRRLSSQSATNDRGFHHPRPPRGAGGCRGCSQGKLRCTPCGGGGGKGGRSQEGSRLE